MYRTTTESPQGDGTPPEPIFLLNPHRRRVPGAPCLAMFETWVYRTQFALGACPTRFAHCILRKGTSAKRVSPLKPGAIQSRGNNPKGPPSPLMGGRPASEAMSLAGIAGALALAGLLLKCAG